MRRSRAVLRSLGAAGLALVLAAQPAAAVTLQPSVAISGTGETVSGALGSIAVSAGRVFVTYLEEQRAWVRVSADGGATFAPPVPVSDPTAVATSPSVAAGRDRIRGVDRDAVAAAPRGSGSEVDGRRGDLVAAVR